MPGGRQSPRAILGCVVKRARRAILALGACLLILLPANGRAVARDGSTPEPTAPRGAFATRLSTSEIDLHAQRAVSGWRGGLITAASGEQLKIFISDSLTPDQASAQEWADFFARLVHGSEFPRVTVWIASPAEVQAICGANTRGCYDPDAEDLYMPGASGDSAIVATHEYGHHVARNRPNPPWRADEFGT